MERTRKGKRKRGEQQARARGQLAFSQAQAQARLSESLTDLFDVIQQSGSWPANSQTASNHECTD